MSIVPEPSPDPPPPRPAQLTFTVLGGKDRGQESAPVYAITGDPELDRDLARIATRLRAKGGL